MASSYSPGEVTIKLPAGRVVVRGRYISQLIKPIDISIVGDPTNGTTLDGSDQKGHDRLQARLDGSGMGCAP